MYICNLVKLIAYELHINICSEKPLSRAVRWAVQLVRLHRIPHFEGAPWRMDRGGTPHIYCMCGCVYCRANAKDRNFDFGRKWVIDIFGTFKTSFIMCISSLSQFRCFSKKIMGGLNRNFENPRRNQGRTPYNTSYRSFTLFGTLKLSYGILPLLNSASKWSYGAGLELYGVLPFFFFFFYCPLKSDTFKLRCRQTKIDCDLPNSSI